MWSIARKNNISVDELKKLNNLTSNSLSLNQVLKLPTSNNDLSTTYTVKSEDTLYKIANQFGLSVNELKSINNLSTNNLSIGQVLKVKKDTNNDSATSDKSSTYTVKSGDTLYSISRKLNVSVDEIKRANNLTNNLLTVGQILQIPTDTTKVYTVKSGDTLYTIARNNNTTVSDLIELNNLSTSNLSIGQKLLLPS